MARDLRYDALAAELATLGRTVRPTEPGTAVTDAVMARISDQPTPIAVSGAEQRLRRAVAAVTRYRQRAAVVATAVLLVLFVMSPVRATVADWFGFAGVRVEPGTGPAPSSAPGPPPATLGSLDQARERVTFEVLAPVALGAPQGVEVSADRRVLSMSWTDARAGVVRLDQFDARLDYTLAKRAAGVRFTTVDGAFALWFDQPHDVVVLDPDGGRRTETARLAGNTLIWEQGATTLRLEGDLELERAVRIAGSVAGGPDREP